MEKRSAQRVLICADWFDPGVRAGGPIRSCINLSLLIGKTNHLSIVTSNRDLGTSIAYESVRANRWRNWRGHATVMYCSNTIRRAVAFAWAVKRLEPRTVYLNSMFSVAGTLWPLVFLYLSGSKANIVLAPRGMLKGSALAQKPLRKKLVIFLLKKSMILNHVLFHATSSDEVDEIEVAFGRVKTNLIPNVPCSPVASPGISDKTAGLARLTFVGRVHPIKNLLWLISLLKELPGRVELSVVGPIEDPTYYKLCCDEILSLPPTISVVFLGVKAEAEVCEILRSSHAMVLPTLGENFGHAIFESFASGVPVVISNRTIWRQLEENSAGWDCPIEGPAEFLRAITQLVVMDRKTHQHWKSGAHKFAQKFLATQNYLQEYASLFFLRT